MLRKVVQSLGMNCLIKPVNNLPKPIINCPFFWNKSLLRNLETNSEDKLSGAISSRYEHFSEETAPVILDIEEERQKIDKSDNINNQYHGINLQRGVHGIFEIEELVDILRKENAQDIFVVRIPPEYRYAQFMVIVTGKSSRHIFAICEFIRKIFKMKMNRNDIIPKIEGKNSKDWTALDLGNIVLHVFSDSARKYYDLETLWAIGHEYDSDIHKKSSQNNLLTDYSNILATLSVDESKQST